MSSVQKTLPQIDNKGIVSFISLYCTLRESARPRPGFAESKPPAACGTMPFNPFTPCSCSKSTYVLFLKAIWYKYCTVHARIDLRFAKFDRSDGSLFGALSDMRTNSFQSTSESGCFTVSGRCQCQWLTRSNFYCQHALNVIPIYFLDS